MQKVLGMKGKRNQPKDTRGVQSLEKAGHASCILQSDYNITRALIHELPHHVVFLIISRGLTA